MVGGCDWSGGLEVVRIALTKREKKEKGERRKGKRERRKKKEERRKDHHDIDHLFVHLPILRVIFLINFSVNRPLLESRSREEGGNGGARRREKERRRKETEHGWFSLSQQQPLSIEKNVEKRWGTQRNPKFLMNLWILCIISYYMIYVRFIISDSVRIFFFFFF